MAGGFGFENQAQQVGQALQQPQPMAPMSAGPIAPPDPDRQIREMGAQYNGAPGQHDQDGAMAAAIGDHLTRMGGGYKTNPNQFKDRQAHARQLMQLGLREEEVSLLMESGGF